MARGCGGSALSRLGSGRAVDASAPLRNGGRDARPTPMANPNADCPDGACHPRARLRDTICLPTAESRHGRSPDRRPRARHAAPILTPRAPLEISRGRHHITAMEQKHPHADAVYRVVTQEDETFGVE